MIYEEVKKLDEETKAAIWLQTEEGEYWQYEIDESEEPENVDYIEGNIIDYMLYHFVLNKAVNWTNKRIEKYLENDY